MPAILKNTDPSGLSTALWEITESFNELLKAASLSTEEKETLDSFRNENRKLQWLAVRVLLAEFIKPRPVILYEANGRPYLKDSNTAISVSHSGNMAAIALYTNGTPGIDVEEIHPKINKIATRFIGTEEAKFLEQETLTNQLCIIWAAKEVLYKIHPEGMLSFKENLSISPFGIGDKLKLTGTITKGGVQTVHAMQCLRLRNYVLVHTV